MRLLTVDRANTAPVLVDRFWPVASFRCDAEFDRYRSTADSRAVSSAALWAHGLVHGVSLGLRI